MAHLFILLELLGFFIIFTCLILILEYEKIERYAAKGDIEKQVVPDEVREACHKLKAILG
jgi:hypothetical protein